MNFIAKRLDAVKPSPSMAVSQAAAAMRAKGIDVIDLGLGEPDFETPPHIVAAAHDAATNGNTRYTATGGAPATKDAVIGKFRCENNLDFQPGQILVANGAKQVIFNALMATMEQGDEAILPAPYFVSYPDMVRMLGGTPVTVETEKAKGFRLTASALEAAITPRTKWLFLNMPGNPSGAVYSAAELKAIGDVLACHPQVRILSDEIYEQIVFDNTRFVSFGEACPDLLDRTLIVNGVSKAYAMTGWRIGYGAGPVDLIRAMTTVQSQSTTNACSIAQAAAVAALAGPQNSVREFRTAFERRRDLVVTGINAVEGLDLRPPQGAFYAYIDCSALIGRKTPQGKPLANDQDFTKYLLDEGKVAAVPGTAYGLSPYFRISTATSDKLLKQAVERINDAVLKLI